jgi:hypothetical protein
MAPAAEYHADRREMYFIDPLPTVRHPLRMRSLTTSCFDRNTSSIDTGGPSDEKFRVRLNAVHAVRVAPDFAARRITRSLEPQGVSTARPLI